MNDEKKNNEVDKTLKKTVVKCDVFGPYKRTASTHKAMMTLGKINLRIYNFNQEKLTKMQQISQ